MVFPEILLNKGIMAKASNMASMQEMKAVKVDSLRNCVIKFLRSVPNTLRTPTSLALFAERAVVRFMKLMQASKRIKKAITCIAELFSWRNEYIKIKNACQYDQTL